MPPLRVHPDNPCWLADAAGRARFLAGSHHWDSLVDVSERPAFDFERYLDRLVAWGHTALRLWAHEAWTHDLSHHPWERTGPGLARDGHPRFDLARLDEAYFARLRARVERAAARGLHVVVMLWNGWSIRDNGEGNPWPRHPFHRDNNVNGIDGDPAGTGSGEAVHTLRVPAVARVQERYLARVVEAVGHLDAVLWEIANESPPASREWQRAMLRRLRVLAGARGAARPAGLTACHPRGSNPDLFASAADWVSPSRHDGWRRSGWMRTPPPNDGRKVVLLDTDHLWGIGGDAAWIWRAALRGHQPLYMDTLDDDREREQVRRALGVACRLLDGSDLAALAPRPELASSRICLGPLPAARKPLATLVAWSDSPSLRIDLRGLSGPLRATWVHPVSGDQVDAGATAGGAVRRLAAPWPDGAVLHVGTAPPPPTSTPLPPAADER
jgi:hypothetical protein